ncbi:hypothetical protein KP509_01G082100 [Ceratopteris richardii]|uniref:Alpha/beta hydrolase fold-3 domain-containing protein n=1 Tax=Ceratopteris richardii TaxID=49495 RepID=A0A8T2VHX8_CERRI|nr:hypothetical protein KP509_01G082100 [Ceratopteris richardii]
METSPAYLDLTDPVKVAEVATESSKPSLSQRLLAKSVELVNGAVRHKDGTVNRRVADLLEYKVPASAVPDHHGVSSKDVVIVEKNGVWARVYLPSAKQAVSELDDGAVGSEGEGTPTCMKRRVIIHIHGGGFAFLCADAFSYDQFCRRLCHRGEAVVISVNYRRAPEHRYPAAYDDCYAVLEWLEGYSGDDFKPHILDLSRCVLIGDSAGANIVHHVGFKWAARPNAAERLAEESTTTPKSQSRSSELRIDCHVLLFPFFGGEERTPSEIRMHRKAPLVTIANTDWHWLAFLPPGSNRDHPACNIFSPDAPPLSSLPLPRSLVTIAEWDMLKDRQLRYAQGLAEASKPVELLYYRGGVHCFHVFQERILGPRLISDIMLFINQRHGDGQSLLATMENSGRTA